MKNITNEDFIELAMDQMLKIGVVNNNSFYVKKAIEIGVTGDTMFRMLREACFLASEEVIDMLLENGAIIDQKSEYGNTILMVLCNNPDATSYLKPIITHLIKRGANPYIEDKGGDNCFYIARKKPEVLDILKLCNEEYIPNYNI